MSRSILAFSTLGLIALFSLTSSCKGPEYPGCKKDKHCRDAEFCIANQCQQCRTTDDCSEGQTCNQGRCEIASECPCADTHYCSGLRCIEKCGGDADCNSGEVCGDEGQCIPGCNSDIECGDGMKCIDGQCATGGVPEACKDSAGNIKLSLVNFEFNAADLTIDARSVLEKNAECIGFVTQQKVLLEGHCDERGTQEYNLALGENRAQAVKRYLTNLGANPSNIQIVSKGKNELLCYKNSESCHARNRRVTFSVQ